jgi:hypothetical protein
MRGLLIIVIAICAVLVVDRYEFDSFYVDRLMDMSQAMMRGLSR